jgi:hypothetical protein
MCLKKYPLQKALHFLLKEKVSSPKESSSGSNSPFAKSLPIPIAYRWEAFSNSIGSGNFLKDLLNYLQQDLKDSQKES